MCMSEFPVLYWTRLERLIWIYFGLSVFLSINTQIMSSAFCEVSLAVTWVYMFFFFFFIIIIYVQCMVKIMETHVSL